MLGMGLLKRFSKKTTAATSFDHEKAQEYEWHHNRQTILETFPKLYEAVERNLSAGGLWYTSNDQFFEGDGRLFDEFVAHVRRRKCLEIGAGPYGFLAPMRWIKDRVIIDPLADKYREAQLQLIGKTFLTSDVVTYARNAESLIDDLTGTIDGAIICRNALDHCEDALTVLVNMSKYAARGCYLLLWTDIWHLQGLDDGHHNITRSPEAMDALLAGLSFEVIRPSSEVRNGSEYIEYGRLARKR